MKEKIFCFLGQVPKGKVTTYKQLAELAGTSPRAVGRMMAVNKDPVNIHCYKVVMSDGSLGGYSGGLEKKMELLERDGIKLARDSENKVKIDFERYLFRPDKYASMRHSCQTK